MKPSSVISALFTVAFVAPLARAGYSQQTAIEYVWMSAAAYCSGESIENWNCGVPCEKAPMADVIRAYNDTHDVQCYVGKRSDTGDIVISFRGTKPQSLKDWIDDLDFAKKSPYPACSDCELHEGFYESYMALKSQIVSGLKSLGVTNTTPVHITGHSLGAAMATVCAFDLNKDGYTVSQSFTFGEPRVGNKAFSDTFTSRIGDSTVYRVTHWRDPVPHLPPEFLEFYHVPREVWYNSNSSSYQVCNGSGEDKNCSDGLDWDISVSDHLHYINIPISGSCDSDKFSFNTPEDFKVLEEAAIEELKKRQPQSSSS